MEFIIGDKVSWTTGKALNKGVFIETQDDEFSLVVTHFNGDTPYVSELKVLTKILNKGWN